MIDPGRVRLFIPNGLAGFKQNLFERVGSKVGGVVRGNYNELRNLPEPYIPVVGASPDLFPIVQHWRKTGRTWIGWDRGYARRVFATWLPRGENGGYYRYHLNAYQMGAIRDLPPDRWNALKIDVQPWRKGGRHIVIAAPTRTYLRSHGCETWISDTIDALARVTDRQIVIRDKETKRPLQADLEGAHCLVAHGSIAAVESVILGCPVVVDRCSAAALVGLTDIKKVESPVYPDRQAWLNALAYSQFSESELVDGTIWRLMS